MRRPTFLFGALALYAFAVPAPAQAPAPGARVAQYGYLAADAAVPEDGTHGCVRVSDPPALAEFLLRSTPGWDAAKIAAAMEAERPQLVVLKPRVPVWLLYTTAAASPDGRIAFFENVYHRGAPAGGPGR